MTEPKSKCCGGEMAVDDSDEGTCCYLCLKCGKPTDPTSPMTGSAKWVILFTGINGTADAWETSEGTLDQAVAQATSNRRHLSLGRNGFRIVPDDLDKRLMLAEGILSELSNGYWVAVLDDNDDPVETRMGQRILNYWRANTKQPTE